MRKDAPALKDVSEAEACAHMRRPTHKAHAFKANVSRLDREQPADCINDGALAGTIGPQQRHALPGGNRE